MYIRVYLLRVYWNHSYGMSTLDLLPMLYIVGLRGRYISTVYVYIVNCCWYQPAASFIFVRLQVPFI